LANPPNLAARSHPELAQSGVPNLSGSLSTMRIVEGRVSRILAPPLERSLPVLLKGRGSRGFSRLSTAKTVVCRARDPGFKREIRKKRPLLSKYARFTVSGRNKLPSDVECRCKHIHRFPGSVRARKHPGACHAKPKYTTFPSPNCDFGPGNPQRGAFASPRLATSPEMLAEG
jgi:hypothetical protein